MFIQTLGTNPLLFFRIVLILILSVSLHELAHGFAALSQGDDPPKKNWSHDGQSICSHGLGVDYFPLYWRDLLGGNARQSI